jgi:hypothetical protein
MTTARVARCVPGRGTNVVTKRNGAWMMLREHLSQSYPDQGVG